MTSPFQQKLTRGDFVITTEISPPKGCDCSSFLEKAKFLRHQIDAINVTDNQGGNMRISPLATATLLLREGIEPILQMTCRDRNRLALQSDLLAAAALGIRNILALSGDHISCGDHPQAKAVFDLDSVQLLETIRRLSAGHDLTGNPLNGAPCLFPGAAAAPEAEPFPLAFMKVEKKITAGARFFQTQAVFSPPRLHSFCEAVRPSGTKVIAGILILRSAAMARYVNRNIPGLQIPESIIEELSLAADPGKKGVEIATRLAAAARPLCDGLHLMAMGREEQILTIMKEIN